MHTDCDSLPERNQVAPQGESIQQLFHIMVYPVTHLQCVNTGMTTN